MEVISPHALHKENNPWVFFLQKGQIILQQGGILRHYSTGGHYSNNTKIDTMFKNPIG